MSKTTIRQMLKGRNVKYGSGDLPHPHSHSYPCRLLPSFLFGIFIFRPNLGLSTRCLFHCTEWPRIWLTNDVFKRTSVNIDRAIMTSWSIIFQSSRSSNILLFTFLKFFFDIFPVDIFSFDQSWDYQNTHSFVCE